MLYSIFESLVEITASVEDIKRAVRELINENGGWSLYDLKTHLKEKGYYVNDEYHSDEDDAQSAYPLDLTLLNQ